MILPGRLSSRKDLPQWGMLDSSQQFVGKNSLLIAKMVVDPKKSCIPIRVMNPTDETQIVYKDTTAAVLCPVEIVDGHEDEVPKKAECCFNTSLAADSHKKETKMVVPPHLADLWERSCEHLEDENGKSDRWQRC